MTTMITEVYDALKSANADEMLARRAAEVLANYDDKFNQLDRRMTSIEGRLRRLNWQVGVLYAILLPLAWLVLRIAMKVGALPG